MRCSAFSSLPFPNSRQRLTAISASNARKGLCSRQRKEAAYALAFGSQRKSFYARPWPHVFRGLPGSYVRAVIVADPRGRLSPDDASTFMQTVATVSRQTDEDFHEPDRSRRKVRNIIYEVASADDRRPKYNHFRGGGQAGM